MELTEKEKKAAQAFARMGGLKGGKARAQALTAEERSESARQAAAARWAREKEHSKNQDVPKVICSGVLTIGDMSIPCAVVEVFRDGMLVPVRVLSENGITNALLGSRSGASKRRKRALQEQGAPVPLFLAPKRLSPFISQDLMDGPLKPMIYQDEKEKSTDTGFDAQILPIVCDIWLKARDAGVLQAQQLDKAKKAEILMRGLAHVAIIALVDEATGYQEIRPHDALEACLALIIRKELAAWVKKFPDEFYINIYKLKGWIWPGMQKNRYSIVGHYTRDLVFERLAPGLLEELERKSPKNEKGYRKNKLHDWLADDVGNPLLAQHLHTLVKFQELAIKSGYTWTKYVKMVDQVMPKRGGNLELPLLDQTSELG
jgi:hypothetical protein